MNLLPKMHRQRVIRLFRTAITALALLVGCASASSGSAVSSASTPSGSAVSNASTPSGISSANVDRQLYRNQQAGYSLAIPITWTVATSAGGTVYFLSREGVDQRNKGLTDWEASVAGIQIVGRHEQFDENAQYEAILPNHCAIVGWSAIQVDSVTGRKYSLDCDSPGSAGTHSEEHVYVPRGDRFAEIWLKTELTPLEKPAPALDKLLSTFHFEEPQ